MDVMTLLIPCFLALLVPAQLGLTKKSIRSADLCVPEITISEDDARDFEKVRKLYEEAIAERPDLGDLVKKVTPEELIPFELANYYYDVCPSETVSPIYWRIPHNKGYRCWTIQHVSFTKCKPDSCQNWNGIPWVPDYKFLCKVKNIYEYIWSFCVEDGTEDDTEKGFFQLIRVKIPKCCVCTLAIC